MFVIEKYLDREFFLDQKNTIKTIKQSLQGIVDNYFSDKTLFDSSKYNIYFFDDYILETNTSKTITLHAYLEINQPKNFKEESLSRKFKDENIKEAHLKLKDIKYDLIEFVINNFNNTVSAGITNNEYSVFLRQETLIEGNPLTINILLTPCFTHEKDGNKGVIYYDDRYKNIQIEYPKLSIKNFKAKNKETGNLYLAFVVLFKNLFQEAMQENNLPTEIFEILLYNVPNNLFNELSLKNIYDILNYLRNKQLNTFKSLDGIDFAFTSKYKTLSYLYAKNVINKIEKHIKKLT